MKCSIKDFFERVTDKVGDKADATIAIVKNGEDITIHMGGIDEFMLGPNAVSMAAAMRHLLDTDMRTADRMGQKRMKEGCAGITRDRMEITELTGDDDKSAPTDANEYGRMLAHALGEFLDILGKHIDAPEDDD